MIEHRTDCLVINGKQSVNLKSGTIKFKNYFKWLPVPFKIYADFECILKKAKSDVIECYSDSSYTKNIKIILLAVLLIKLLVLTINLVRKLLCTEERILFTNLLNQFLMSTIIAGE